MSNPSLNQTSEIIPISYPARPLNGGALDVALPKRGDWRAEPKYNGWRALVHVPTGAMFNRQLERLSIEKEFASAVAQASRLSLPEWIDCEALDRRHNIGRGSLILLDLIVPTLTYTQRREQLAALDLPSPFTPGMFLPGSLYLAPSYPNHEAEALYWSLQQVNAGAGCDFYEGIVCKRAERPYPIQRISASRETADWIKHRWRA